MKYFYENAQVFIIGSLLYSSLEILFRGFTHWTMFFAGGLCFTILYNIFIRNKGMSLWKKCIIGTFIITSVELIVGYTVNIILNWNVWDYSHYPFDLRGQVCLLFTALWFVLSAPIVWLTNKLQRITRTELRF